MGNEILPNANAIFCLLFTKCKYTEILISFEAATVK